MALPGIQAAVIFANAFQFSDQRDRHFRCPAAMVSGEHESGSEFLLLLPNNEYSGW
jgi:hypothetical protein